MVKSGTKLKALEVMYDAHSSNELMTYTSIWVTLNCF